MFSKALKMLLNFVLDEAKRKHHEIMTVEHLLLALIRNHEVAEVLMACEVNLEALSDKLNRFIDEVSQGVFLGMGEKVQPQPNAAFQRVLQRAVFQAQSLGKLEVTGVNILAAIMSEEESRSAQFLSDANVKRSDVIAYMSKGISKPAAYGENETGAIEHMNSSDTDAEMLPLEAEGTLERYAVNLNEQARMGKIDPLIGRKDEMQRAIQVLCRRHKNNPLLVGESGVGKTAIAEGLARLIVAGEVPFPMANSVVYSLDLGYLLAGTKYRGDFEKRFKGVLKALKQIPNTILFIDEIHTLVGAGAASGGAMDASNLLKPLLSSGQLRCMGSTTYQEYRNIFEKDHALSRRFQKIDVPEPTVDETYEILKGLKEKFEQYHNVSYTIRGLKAAAVLSEQHINDRYLPDKAIDVIDEAGAYQRLQSIAKNKKIIGVKEIEAIVAKMARVPSASVSMSDKEILKNLDRNLKTLIFGQNEAIEALATAIKLSRSGLREPEKPVGCFLLSGPTGVGKTEVTKQLAKLLGIELLRFDMSEYTERHMISRLIGAPPGYVGYEQAGLLTEAVIKHPYCVVLLDEIEKAHHDIYNLLLQVMDYGKLTDNNGKIADFRHVILIMTSNAGAQEIDHMRMGFTEDKLHTDDLDAVKHTFSPEFRNRLDAIISFKPLSEEVLGHIVDKFMMELEVQLEHKHVRLRMDADSRHFLITHGYDQHMGARPMGRLIQEKIKKPLAEELLFGRLMLGGSVAIEAKEDQLVLNIKSAEKMTV